MDRGRSGDEVERAGGHLLRHLERSDEGPWPDLEEMSDRPLCNEDQADTWTININSTRQRRAGTVLLADGSARSKRFQWRAEQGVFWAGTPGGLEWARSLGAPWVSAVVARLVPLER